MRNLLAWIHNPHGLTCACDPDCFCNTTWIGRAIKWRVPAGFLSRLGLHHKNRELEEWKRMQGPDALRKWKRQQSES